jgi:isocitrate dehydrogenase
MKLVTRPDKYDFVVLPNLQGDIISDLCAGLVGGLGMAPSANLGDDISIFEAVHGTAPDITGKNLANPTALLMSGIMMLRRLGLSEKAHYIEQSLFKTLSSGVRTIDLSQIPETKAASTSEFAASIIANLAPEAKKESGAVKWPKIPTSKPLENQMMKSPQRDLAKEKTVGIDVFVDCDFVPSKLAAELKSLTSNLNVTLQMISNRGTQVYPTGSVFTQVVNHYRCRFLSDTLSETQLLGVAQTLSKNLRVCSIEMLRTIDGKEKFSLAQGQ